MNYPIWELTGIGGGTLIAIIAILHVYISHLAVGGGIFIWLTDWKGYRENNPDIHAYIKKHTWFFLLLTMVFGGMSGVGIWFIISLVNPATTSKLIHAFVFGWAIEWVFFLGEVIALLIYHYMFDYLDRKGRMALSFLYALFAWLSLAVINAILSFMLTPGKWLETGNFWDGILNPTYFSSLVFRTFIAAMFAGLFGYVTAVYMKESEFRTKMIRYCTKWLLYPIIGLVLSGIWYYYAIPESIRFTTFDLNPDTTVFVNTMIVTTILIFVFGLFMLIKASRGIQKIAIFVLIIIGLGWIGGFEYVREIARKPYLINDYIYSTSILKNDVPELNKTGVLAKAKWVTAHSVTENNMIQAGRELFNIQCLGCHTVGGFRNDILTRVKDMPYFGVLSQLEGLGKINRYMPPFVGTDKEKEALATYIVGKLKGEKIVREITRSEIVPKEIEIPPFNQKNDQYVLLAWNDLGMHCISDCDKWFVILPPANTLEAQLIGRGDNIGVVTDPYKLTYKVEPGFENPSRHVEFWKYANSNYGMTPEINVGLAGKGMSGTMDFNDDDFSYAAHFVPVVPYSDSGYFNPFPTFTIEARDPVTDALLATTKMVAPTSTEMGCKTCHGGPWRYQDMAGTSDETASNILMAHDRLSGTSLYQEALDGNPHKCQECHADPAIGAEGKPDVLNLSAAMHGWHANYMPFPGAEACTACHPASVKGRTRCQRGIHTSVGISCVNCHGYISEHALSLLKHESDKPAAGLLMANLKPVTVASIDEINARMPWVNEPECLTCHVDFQPPGENATGFNSWTAELAELYRKRTDDAGIRCIACHNSPHSIYPTINIYGKNLNNMQPMQYMGRPYAIGEGGGCVVCHMMEMEYPIHHENMNRKARNRVPEN